MFAQSLAMKVLVEGRSALDARQEVQVAALGRLQRIHVELVALDPVLGRPHAGRDRRPSDLADGEHVGPVVQQRRPPEALALEPPEVGRLAGRTAAWSRSQRVPSVPITSTLLRLVPLGPLSGADCATAPDGASARARRTSATASWRTSASLHLCCSRGASSRRLGLEIDERRGRAAQAPDAVARPSGHAIAAREAAAAG